MGLLLDTVKGTLRIAQTSSVIAKTAGTWMLGDRPPNPKLLRTVFEELGATYIKLGQFIASSPTFFPKDYVEEFQHCLDRTKPFSFTVAKKIIESELQKPIDSVYSWVDPKPLASASIAQVHAAKLLSGEDVVIKIQKPGVENVLLTDLNFLYVCARVIERLAPKLSWTSLSGVVEEIQRTMMEECDFIKEANNLKVFRDFLHDTHNEDAAVPRVFEHCSTRRILTMERFHGVSLTDLESIRGYARDPERTLITAMNTWFASLTQCDFFHADLHSGNLMLLENGCVGFIDFGMVGRIKPSVWEATFALFMAVNQQDYAQMARSMLAIGVTRKEVDVEELARDIEKLFRRLDGMEPEYLLGSGGREPDGVTNLMTELGDIAKSYGIRFPRSFTMLLKQFLYFDRYMDLLAPGVNIFGDERFDLYQE